MLRAPHGDRAVWRTRHRSRAPAARTAGPGEPRQRCQRPRGGSTTKPRRRPAAGRGRWGSTADRIKREDKIKPSAAGTERGALGAAPSCGRQRPLGGPAAAMAGGARALRAGPARRPPPTCPHRAEPSAHPPLPRPREPTQSGAGGRAVAEPPGSARLGRIPPAPGGGGRSRAAAPIRGGTGRDAEPPGRDAEPPPRRARHRPLRRARHRGLGSGRFPSSSLFASPRSRPATSKADPALATLWFLPLSPVCRPCSSPMRFSDQRGTGSHRGASSQPHCGALAAYQWI